MAIICAVFYFCILVLGLILYICHSEIFSEPFAWSGFFCLFLLFFIMSLRMILFAIKYQITVEKDHIQMDDFLRTETIYWRNLQSISWKLIPVGGGVVLKDDHHSIKIALSLFTENHKRELIEQIHILTPSNLNQKWEEFQKKVLSKKESNCRNGAAGLLFFVYFLLFSVGFSIAAYFDYQVQYVVLAALSASVGFYYLGRAISFWIHRERV